MCVRSFSKSVAFLDFDFSGVSLSLSLLGLSRGIRGREEGRTGLSGRVGMKFSALPKGAAPRKFARGIEGGRGGRGKVWRPVRELGNAARGVFFFSLVREG